MIPHACWCNCKVLWSVVFVLSTQHCYCYFLNCGFTLLFWVYVKDSYCFPFSSNQHIFCSPCHLMLSPQPRLTVNCIKLSPLDNFPSQTIFFKHKNNPIRLAVYEILKSTCLKRSGLVQILLNLHPCCSCAGLQLQLFFFHHL